MEQMPRAALAVAAGAFAALEQKLLDDAGEAPDGDTECRARWLTAVRLGVRMMRQGTRRAFSGNDPILALVGSYRPRGRSRTLEVRLF
jgi:hypothetical protein